MFELRHSPGLYYITTNVVPMTQQARVMSVREAGLGVRWAQCNGGQEGWLESTAGACNVDQGGRL